MESISLHARLPNLARKGDKFGQSGLRAVEAGVEAGHLWYVGQPGRHRFDRGEVVRLVQRREGMSARRSSITLSVTMTGFA